LYGCKSFASQNFLLLKGENIKNILTIAVYKDGSKACSKSNLNIFVCTSNAEKNENMIESINAQINTINEKMYVLILISFFVSVEKYPAVNPAIVLDSIELPSKLPVIRSIRKP
jgi:hypothetical protein